MIAANALGFREIVSLKGGRPATRGLNRRRLLILRMMPRDYSEDARNIHSRIVPLSTSKSFSERLDVPCFNRLACSA